MVCYTFNIMIPNILISSNKNKGSSLLSPAHWAGGARATIEFNNSPSAKKSGEARKQAGKKKKGSGGNEFLPARSVWGGKRFRLSSLEEGQNRKIFVSLIEKNFGGQTIKKCRENFSVLLAVRWAETLGGSIGKILWILLKESSDFVQQTPPLTIYKHFYYYV